MITLVDGEIPFVNSLSRKQYTRMKYFHFNRDDFYDPDLVPPTELKVGPTCLCDWSK